jgi:hypothetical protein
VPGPAPGHRLREVSGYLASEGREDADVDAFEAVIAAILPPDPE